MDFLLTDEQKMIVDTARKVGERFGLDYWRERDAKKAFPNEFWAAVCEAGLCGVALPEQYGGAGSRHAGDGADRGSACRPAAAARPSASFS